jgi:hypothetical protein
VVVIDRPRDNQAVRRPRHTEHRLRSGKVPWPGTRPRIRRSCSGRSPRSHRYYCTPHPPQSRYRFRPRTLLRPGTRSRRPRRSSGRSARRCRRFRRRSFRSDTAHKSRSGSADRPDKVRAVSWSSGNRCRRRGSSSWCCRRSGGARPTPRQGSRRPGSPGAPKTGGSLPNRRNLWYGGPAQSRFHSQTSPAKSSWPQSPAPREAVPTEAMLARPVQLGLGPPSVAYPDPFAW